MSPLGRLQAFSTALYWAVGHRYWGPHAIAMRDWYARLPRRNP
jgi:hypothetical protein